MAQPVAASLLTHASSFMYLFIGLFGINLLVGFHELGHFLFAKLFRVATPSFSIGFGPALVQKKIGDTVFKLSAIPLGGYVEIAGMQEVGQGEQKDAQRRDSGSFAVKPFWQKLLILLGGILFNMIFAYAAFTLLFATGIPKTPLLYPLYSTTVIEQAMPDAPGAVAGLAAGDEIISVNGVNVRGNAALFMSTMSSLATTTAHIAYVRDGSEHTTTIDYTKILSQYKGKLGVRFAPEAVGSQSIGAALKKGFHATNSFFAMTARSFISLFKQCSTDGVGGPLMIISSMMQGARFGFKIWLLLLAIISVNLAVLNLIPVPILDGGQILFTVIEAVLRRPLSEHIRMIIHYICWIAVMLLVVYLSCKDIKTIFWGNTPKAPTEQK